jgi:hypothetical protein
MEMKGGVKAGFTFNDLKNPITWNLSRYIPDSYRNVYSGLNLEGKCITP